MSVEVNNATRVSSGEDILQDRRAKITVVIDPWHTTPTKLTMGANEARALAKMLNRHANFINPPKKRRRS